MVDEKVEWFNGYMVKKGKEGVCHRERSLAVQEDVDCFALARKDGENRQRGLPRCGSPACPACHACACRAGMACRQRRT